MDLLIAVPSDQKKKANWYNAIGLDPSTLGQRKQNYVCNLHFSESDYFDPHLMISSPKMRFNQWGDTPI